METGTIRKILIIEKGYVLRLVIVFYLKCRKREGKVRCNRELCRDVMQIIYEKHLFSL
jgi:hypothetical protein